MVNILVVEDNVYYSKNLINAISDMNSQIRVYRICTDGKETIDAIKNYYNKIDIILLDLQLPYYNGIDILKYIQLHKLEKYKNSIIVISSHVNLTKEIINSPYLYTFLNKISGLDNILLEINKLIQIKNLEKNSLYYKVRKELKRINYNFSYVGTKYLLEVILLLYNEKNWEDIKLEKSIYPILAKKHKKTVNNIKTNIINSTELMYCSSDINIINKYFNFYNNEKPTPKLVISTIIDKLKYDL